MMKYDDETFYVIHTPTGWVMPCGSGLNLECGNPRDALAFSEGHRAAVFASANVPTADRIDRVTVSVTVDETDTPLKTI